MPTISSKRFKYLTRNLCLLARSALIVNLSLAHIIRNQLGDSKTVADFVQFEQGAGLRNEQALELLSTILRELEANDLENGRNI